MEEEELRKLKEDFYSAQDLREEADRIEQVVADRVANEVQEWLDLGKKTQALKVINDVYGNEDGGERNSYWYKHFQTIIYKHM
ncbi:MAG: hypothetical protein WD512_13785 [Candidatus Paceibacterota bacterium]